MIQAFGLTSNPRNELPPALDDVSFEARAGRVTVLLGAPGAGKTTALRLMLELQQGRGVTYFRGRPLHRIAHPSREVGVLLGDVPGHPARTVRGHLRMLCAAAGVPARRADEVLEVVGIVSLREERLGTLSRGMDRRLGLACALLADPHTLVLDNPAEGLSERESRWLHGMLRAHAAQGGTVLSTTADSKEATRIADRVVTLDQGRLVADQEARDFARTRLRPRVAVRSPHAARLAALLAKEARTGRRSVEVVQEGGNRLSVYGSTCADVGETAFRHGILVHQLADETGDMGPGAAEKCPEVREDDRPPGEAARASAAQTPAAQTPAVQAPAPGPALTAVGGERRPSPVPHQPVNRAASRGTGTPRKRGRTEPSAPAAAKATPPGTADAAPVPVPTTTATGARASATAPRPATDEAPAAITDEAPPSATREASPATAREASPAVTGDAPSAVTGEVLPVAAGEMPPPASRNVQPPLGAEVSAASAGEASPTRTGEALPALPPPISVRPAPSPLRPLRYEVRRASGISTGFLTTAAVLIVSAVTALLLARIGHTPHPRLLAAWPAHLPLPPAALGAGLVGALAFGDEFRHPALAADRGTVPRRLGLLTAKLVVTAVTAVMMAFLTVGCDAEVLYLVHGREFAKVPEDWPALSASWVALVVGCAWAGVLAAGVFRSTTAGLAAVLAVPVVGVPLVQKAVESASVRTAAGVSVRAREVFLLQWPFGGERYLTAAGRVVGQPVGGALALALAALLCTYVLTTLRSRVR
ncbi:ATP-binding cassette domain-containing protein [Streptomyces sp. NPDC003247]|uniref:ABC transporter ATP-binding protein n=1 Tax=Streptomyces sp. NPDC003247 TaxID=3364677 RepID=UPI003674969D